MAGLLADIFSYGDGLKRKVKGLLADPIETAKLGLVRFGEDQNDMINLARNAYPMAGERTVLNNPQQLSAMRKQLAGKATDQAMGAATVWHGSPHKFDKFDSSKIGTGEGAQAYGHGLYLAESPEVAGQYAKNIMGPTATPENIALKVINATGDESVAAMRLKQIYPKMTDAEIGGAITNAKGYQGNTYKVDLPDEHIAKMLDWDKPLSQQAPEVQAALNGIETNFPEIPDFNLRKWMDADPLASTWHNVLQRDLGAEPAMITQTLKGRGVPGIRYLDGGSRADGAGTSNFVVFPGNEGLLQILERNGQPIGGLLK